MSIYKSLQESSLCYRREYAGTSESSQPDWPMWGKARLIAIWLAMLRVCPSCGARNFKRGTDEIDLSTTKNVHWVASLVPSIRQSDSRRRQVFVGTNNESPRDGNQLGDRGVLMAFNQETGDFEWQLLIPKLGAGG